MVGLRAAIGAACGRPALAGRVVDQPRRSLAGPLALRLHARLGKMMQEFAALVAHLAAFGADPPSRAPRRKPAPRPDAAAPTRPGHPPGHPPRHLPGHPIGRRRRPARIPPRAPRAPRLPSNFGWLPGLSTSVAIGASQLRHLLTDPELLALLHTSPALVRMLRPLCWMLGVDLPATVLPPRPAPAEPDGEPKPPRRRRRRLWRPPSRRSDMLLLLRMGTPLICT